MPYTRTSDFSSIISKGISCPATQNCTLLAGGHVTAHRTLNTTLPPSTLEDGIFDLISTTIGLEFNDTVTTRLADSSLVVDNGTAGHVSFMPLLECARGELSGCGDAGVGGLVVEACTPYSVADGEIAGAVDVVVGDVEGAEALTCNPANTSLAMQGQSVGNCSSVEGEAQSGGAVRVKGEFVSVGLVSLGVVWFVGL